MDHTEREVIRVILADDHPIVRSGIRCELIRCPDIQVIGEAVSGDQVLALAQTLQADVLLLDVYMPGPRAVDIVRRLRKELPALCVVMLSAYGDDEHVIALLAAGARGYILKDEEPAVIVGAVRAVKQGTVWLSSSVGQVIARVTERVEADTPKIALTPRELEVLQMMAQGWDNRKIAEAMCVTEATIKFHVSHIYGKLAVTSRVEAVLCAARQGWVELRSSRG